MYILKVRRDKTQVLKTFPSDEINGTKNAVYLLYIPYF